MSLSRRQVANAIRVLSMDAVQAAKSGHPGMPMGMADIAEVLWNSYLVHNPQNPQWPNRDRFVVSNGHGSMLLYALLHLSGYDLPMYEIRRFRQLHSKTPGHPEYRCTPGVETTTGPLGQGFANAVGMAMAERMLAARFNREGHTLIDHHTYVFAGDGCLMEGISHEAASLAGTLALGKLIVLYDDNGISIDGDTGGWFTDDTAQRFRAYGWHVVPSVDGHDSDAIVKAIDEARATDDRPSMLCCKTTIGYGAPNKQGTAASHGAPLGDDEIERAREFLGWQHPPFVVPTAFYEAWDARERGRTAEQQWNEQLQSYREAFPDLAVEFVRCSTGAMPHDWKQQAALLIKTMDQQASSVATRQASQLALERFGPLLPELVGGSADLTGSNLTQHATSKPFTKDDPTGNYVYYGVREFAMAAIMNGMALHGGVRPYGGTFLMFSEYARNALRMAALMDLPSVFVLTHDSIGLGEDGPTHQAVEQTATLRLLPNMSVWRPCDAVETTVAWQLAIERSGPTCLVLSRQSVPHQTRSSAQIANITRGAYVLHEPTGTLHGIMLATGSEVSLALDTARYLQTKGLHLRVVSMPCCDVFDKQDTNYKESLLPDSVRQRFAIEAGVSDGWHKYVGLDGMVIGIDAFGESAPAADVFAHFGFSVAQIAARIEASLQSQTADLDDAIGSMTASR